MDEIVMNIEEFKQKVFSNQPVSAVIVRKQFNAEVKQLEEELTLDFTISTGSVDRDGDKINPAGWKVDNYMKNPVVLFAHDYKSLPVANATAIWVEGNALRARAKFTPEELYPFGYMVYRFYRDGFMKATSVGFNPIKWEPSKDRKEGIDFEEQELLEFSCVPVPANPEALVVAKSKGINVTPLKEWAERILDEWSEDEDGILIPKSNVEQIYKLLNGKRIYTLQKGGAEVNKGVITYGQAHPDGTPKAPEDEEWDAAREVAEADVEDLKVMCAWYDSDNPDIKGSYKLPHHKASGQHAVVWRAVAAAMAALLGARGGVNIPEADKKEVYNHLAKHYEEFDREPPEFASIEEIVDKYVGGEAMQKAGRVLSKANEQKIRQAKDLLDEVLAQLNEQPEQDDDKDKEGGIIVKTADDEPRDEPEQNPLDDVEQLKALLETAIKNVLNPILGKVD